MFFINAALARPIERLYQLTFCSSLGVRSQFLLNTFTKAWTTVESSNSVKSSVNLWTSLMASEIVLGASGVLLAVMLLMFKKNLCAYGGRVR